MMMRAPGRGRDAASLRFLALCIGGWVMLRVLMLWNPAIPPPPPGVQPPWAVPSPFAAPARRDLAAAIETPATRRPDPQISDASATVLDDGARVAGRPAGVGGFGGDLRRLRLALMGRLLPSTSGAAAAPDRAPAWLTAIPRATGAPGQGKPFWMQRPLANWSLGGWLYLRQGSARGAEAIAAGGQLGGSQAGLRLAYGFGDSGRLRAYGRATIALRQPDQRELAFGAAFAPLSRFPVDVAVEQRVAVGSEGRTALTAMVVGGVSDVALPAGFRLDAYAQAGVVGARRRDGFADGAVVIDRRLGADDRAPFRLGALAAGAVQPGASRVDVGPRLTLRLPDVGKGSRIALDWRQRIVGDARPESGAALTLATDF